MKNQTAKAKTATKRWRNAAGPQDAWWRGLDCMNYKHGCRNRRGANGYYCNACHRRLYHWRYK
jgi:hypothetical protein